MGSLAIIIGGVAVGALSMTVVAAGATYLYRRRRNAPHIEGDAIGLANEKSRNWLWQPSSIGGLGGQSVTIKRGLLDDVQLIGSDMNDPEQPGVAQNEAGSRLTQSWSSSCSSASLSGNESSGVGSAKRHLASPDKMLLGRNGKKQLNENVQSPSPSGQLEFNAAYDHVNQCLTVGIIQASIDLSAIGKTVLGTSDVYVKLQLLPEKRHRVKTRVCRNEAGSTDRQQCRFDELFKFPGLTVNQIKATSLHFAVLGFDRFSRDQILGEMVCHLGELSLNLTQEVTLTKDILPRQFRANPKGPSELLISICHQPAANRLTLVVLKARNLPQADVTGVAGDPYVKLYLVSSDGQRLARKKTQMKRRTLNPVYNEAFNFDLPANTSLDNLTVEAQVLEWNRVTRNETLGCLCLGLSGTENTALLPCASGERHWRQVMENPRKQIAEWHQLAR